MRRRAPVAAALLAAALTAGCVSGDTEDPGGLPHRELAVTPESLPPAPVPSLPTAAPSTPAGTTLRPPSSGSAPPASGPVIGRPGGSSAPGATAGPGAAYRRVGGIADGTGDTEGRGPGYADLVAVTVEDDGTNARITVVFAADVPARLPADETMGVGVDLFRSATQGESDYQVFADGEPDGWFAYLQTPKGFVRYPGRFGVGGRRLEFVLPWSALGSPAAGRFSAFADWTRDAEPVKPFSEDHAPSLGNAAYRR
ncbi:MAG TPA: hypothetical protein VF519_11135 [Mycobacteriales bacterium]|jgi:hypothetical protein